MNIVIYYEFAIEKQKGGVEKMSIVLSEMLKSLGHSVFFLSWENKIGIHVEENQFFLPNRCLSSYENRIFIDDFVNEHSIDYLINQAAILPKNYPVCEFFKNNKVKIIHVFHNSLYGVYSRFELLEKLSVKFPLITHITNSVYIKSAIIALFKLKYGRYYRHLGKTEDTIVLLSKKYMGECIDFCRSITISRIQVIPNPIPFEINNDTCIKSKILLFCGRLNCQKRPINLLRIWKKIYLNFPDWKLVMLGDGELYPHIKKYIEKYDLKRIDLLGNVNPIPFYRSASILCMTSSYEGLPLVLLEGFNYSCVPIIYNTYGSATEIVSNNIDGIVVNDDSESDYIESLSELMSNETFLNELRNKGRAKLNFYSYEIIKNKWGKLIC